MSICISFSWYYKSDDLFAILLSSCITASVGFALWKTKGKNTDNQIRKRDGYVVVTMGWLFMSFFGMLPYLLSGTIPSVTDAFFETMSGFTTTGASILNDIESIPKGILFWRSMTQWIGGMGIIVMTIAILPILGIGGMELFQAEAPGPTSDKIHPRITETAKRLWMIYVSLTGVLALLLLLGGMTFFDSINHALTTMATGGFSTKQASILHWDSPYIHYVITLFMIIAGTNYTLLYYGLKRKFEHFLKSEEFVTYLSVIAVLTVTITIGIFISSDNSFERSFREAFFQVASIITTTGFVTTDYSLWPSFLTIMVLLMMFIGGSAGSTSGGIKVIRHYVMAKNCFLEFKRLLHPRAVVPVKIAEKIVSPSIITNVLVFILFYLLIFMASAILLSSTGLTIDSAIGATATTLGNVGPGLGSVGPMHNFSEITCMGKWFLSFLMLIGRLEIFTVLVLFTPYFWRNN